MEKIVIISMFAVAFGLVVFIRLMAKKDHIFGRICRWFWNTSFKVSSFMPFMGWMARFIIADSDEEIREKEEWIKIGDGIDGAATDYLVAQAAKEKARQAEEDRIRKALTEKYGANNISVNADNTFATFEDRYGNRYEVDANDISNL